MGAAVERIVSYTATGSCTSAADGFNVMTRCCAVASDVAAAPSIAVKETGAEAEVPSARFLTMPEGAWTRTVSSRVPASRAGEVARALNRFWCVVLPMEAKSWAAVA